MNRGEAFRSALDNLAAHKLRSTLSMLGMIFGVGAVIAMLSIGAGAEREALKMIDRLGLRNVLVRAIDARPESEPAPGTKKSIGLSLRDVRAIGEAVPGVAATDARVRVRVFKVLAPGTKCEARVSGVGWLHAEIAGLTLAEGRFLDALDERAHAQAAVIGQAVRRDLFGFGPALGRELKVNDVWFEVVGVLATTGGGGSFEGVSVGSTEREILVPATTALRKFEMDPTKSPLDEVVVQLNEGVSARETAALLKALLDRLHAGSKDFELVVPEALLAQSRRTQRLFNIVMGCIAGISLLVGGIGIMNVMLTTVLERTREIGVRRAIGARREDIRFQFVVESFSISLLGGAAGVAMGLLIAGGVALYAGWPTRVTLVSVLLSTGVSAAVGLASGVYPAVRAAELDPIEALRYE